MINLLHIAEGWGKSLGLFEVSAENKQLSVDRMKICAACPHAKSSSILKLIKGSANELDAIVCNLCGCPINEKTLVTDEVCPINKW